MNSFDLMTEFLYDCQVPYLKDWFKSNKYPWEMVGKIKDIIYQIIEGGAEGFKEISEGVFVGDNVSIAASAVMIPPVIIGANTEIRPGAYLRGNIITGRNCVIGNSSELKNCIILDSVQLPHYNYVGDSVLGNRVHLGAGAICSNLKAQKNNVSIHAHLEIDTGLRKLGAMLADGADIGCGCVLNPGTVIGKNTSVYPLSSIRGVIPADSIVKSMENIVMRKEVL